jgi:hypothetical protein
MPSAACVINLLQNVARSWRLMVRAVWSVTTDPSTRQPIGRSYLRKKERAAAAACQAAATVSVAALH